MVEWPALLHREQHLNPGRCLLKKIVQLLLLKCPSVTGTTSSWQQKPGLLFFWWQRQSGDRRARWHFSLCLCRLGTVPNRWKSYFSPERKGSESKGGFPPSAWISLEDDELPGSVNSRRPSCLPKTIIHFWPLNISRRGGSPSEPPCSRLSGIPKCLPQPRWADFWPGANTVAQWEVRRAFLFTLAGGFRGRKEQSKVMATVC